jgi:CheY-like chemotaxis protein
MSSHFDISPRKVASLTGLFWAISISEHHATESKRILLVDDEPDVTLTFKTGLEGEGYKVDAFNDPEESLANFKMGIYNLLLLDLKLPKAN